MTVAPTRAQLPPPASASRPPTFRRPRPQRRPRPGRAWRLGQLLLERETITAAQLEAALRTQRSTGSRLGSILVAAGALTPRELSEALATSWRARFADGAARPVVAEEFAHLDIRELLRDEWVPGGRDEDGTLILVTARRPDRALHERVHQLLGEPVRFAVGSERYVSRLIQATYRQQLLDHATLGLWQRDRSASARAVLDRRQQVVLLAGALLLAVAAAAFPRVFVSAAALVVAVAFSISTAFKFVVCMRGARHEYLEVVTQTQLDALVDRELPVYTVLVPCYREQGIVAQLVDNLGRLDYPADKLEILLLLEADDEETIAAAYASNPPANLTIVVTPDGQPKTKPKACNVGLLLATGDYLVIYDAEDRPDPDQLKRSVVAFANAGPETVCVQAALNYFNADENVLTRMFTLEYSFWFDYMLPGLDAAKLPIPLGGTSNHFRTDMLRELGGWDPFNVTEDADLGIRASAKGYRVGVIDSTTFEEANNAFGNWLRQRSRWIKGYMQTTLVHLRHPAQLVRTAGPVQALAFLLLIGGTSVTFLGVIPLLSLFVITLFLAPSALFDVLPGWVIWLSLANLLLGNSLMIWVSMMGAFRRQRYWLVLWALLNPFYWVLHSISAYKALWQLIFKPHYWEKTTHGLSTVDAADSDHAEGGAVLVR